MEPMPTSPAVEVDYYRRDGSVFLDTHYLIKGVAGALLWKLLREHQHSRRNEFSLRELRLAGPELRLPEVQDNLSVRMLLLQRRLADRGAPVQIVKAGRGRFRIEVHGPLRLNEKPEFDGWQPVNVRRPDLQPPERRAAAASSTPAR